MIDNSIKNNNGFSISHTTFIKGIAVLLLVIHHYIGLDKCNIVDLTSTNAREIIYNICKVCVSIFAILSGFGVYKKVDKNHLVKQSIRRIFLLLIGYWLAFFVWLFNALRQDPSLKTVYDENVIFSLIKDFFGACHIGPITSSLNGVSWFIGTIILFYMLFPILFLVINKLGKIDFLLLIITYIPLALLIFNIKLYNGDSIVYYLFSFVLGMYLAKHNILDYFVKQKSNIRVIVIIIFSTMIMGIIRLVTGMMLDAIFGVLIIVLFTFIIHKNYIIDNAVSVLGKNEMYIYLFHMWLLIMLSYHINNSTILYLAAIVSTLIVSVVFTWVFNRIIGLINRKMEN